MSGLQLDIFRVVETLAHVWLPVPFPFNVLGDYNGADPPDAQAIQQAPTKHAHLPQTTAPDEIANLKTGTRRSAPTMKAPQVEDGQRAPSGTYKVGMKEGKGINLFGHALPLSDYSFWTALQRRLYCAVRRTAQHKSAYLPRRNGRG